MLEATAQQCGYSHCREFSLVPTVGYVGLGFRVYCAMDAQPNYAVASIACLRTSVPQQYTSSRPAHTQALLTEQLCAGARRDANDVDVGDE